MDVLCVSETWLNAEIYDCTVQIPGYDILRADSPSGRRKHGVMFYVRNGLTFVDIPINVPNAIAFHLGYIL